ncbi:alpha/beta fold hydrolase [Roseateles sp.]|uniref:alpha/beta fold hydrolase n=1 Tax=Roseateles sp. TaxID=1971397 RepID=UPI003D0AE19A
MSARIIVGVHGRPGNARSLDDIGRWAAGRGDGFLTYDQYGVNRPDCQRIPDDTLLDHLVAELADVVGRVAPQSEVVLWGHSFGAMLCAHLLGRRPSALARPVAAAVLSGFCPRRREFLDYNESRLRLSKAEFDRRHLCRADPWPEAFARSMRAVPHGDVPLADDYDDVVRAIDVPVLLLRGEHDICSEAQQREVTGLLRNAQAHAVTGASHYLFVEDPDSTFAIADGFLGGLDTRPSGAAP